MKIALASFVKTPSFSPLKTRLAKDIGHKNAEMVFIHCVKVVERLFFEIKAKNLLEPFWAVGEKEGMKHSLWAKFPRLYTGEGSLGERLNCIYTQLLKEYDIVLLLGADSPHISLKTIEKVCLYLKKHKAFVFIPSYDGGFCLMGGKSSISLDEWKSVHYSQKSTLKELCKVLERKNNKIKLLDKMTDIDEIGNFSSVIKEMAKSNKDFSRLRKFLEKMLMNYKSKKSFNELCYSILRNVPEGRVTTYKAIALALKTKAYRAVGNAMNKNPYHYTDVPCHRVVKSSGEIGGFALEIEEKINRLAREGIEVKNNKIVDFPIKIFDFK